MQRVLCKNKKHRNTCKLLTVEAPVSGNPREAEKVFASGAGRLRECVNAVYELEFKRNFVKASRAVCEQECPLRKLRLY